MPEVEKMFTQADLNAIQAKDRRADRERIAALEAQLADSETLKSSLTAAASDLESQLAKATSERDQFAAKLSAADERAKNAESKAQGVLLRHHISTSLTSANAHLPALNDAQIIFAAKVKASLTDDGQPGGAEYAGKAFDSLADATRAFLADHPHFAAGSPGGSGSRVPATYHGDSTSHRAHRDLSPAELAQQGLKEAAR